MQSKIRYNKIILLTAVICLFLGGCGSEREVTISSEDYIDGNLPRGKGG